MVDRHWDAISKQVGFDIRPDENFTLNRVVEKGLLKHTELCEEVGERAYKEKLIGKVKIFLFHNLSKLQHAISQDLMMLFKCLMNISSLLKQCSFLLLEVLLKVK
jgi:hypothetical protein